MAAKLLPPAEVLRQFLSYDPQTGALRWRQRTPDMFAAAADAQDACRKWNARHAGKEAFRTVSAKGYKVGTLYKHSFFAHRVIWKMQTGLEPTQLIDHINGKRDDNRWSNLREASPSQNRMNVRKTSCASGQKGVYRHSGKWTSRITAYGKKYYLGCFETKEGAAAAYKAAEKSLFQDFSSQS